MDQLQTRFLSLGISIPEILMPAKHIPCEKWSVVACDQFSSSKTYWEGVEERTQGSPSTLNLILPEAYLDESEQRLAVINRNMNNYLSDGTLEIAGKGFVYLNRSTPWVQSRKGLVVALDLEHYSYELGAECQIRPTEGTVLERLPVRAAIRAEASLDLPHILVLFDDPKNEIFTLLDDVSSELPDLYNFTLGEKGGELQGKMIKDSETLAKLAELFTGLNEKSDFLFAVGDGNHSLGAAKQLWEKIKKESGVSDHPARYALVELENIHDQGLNFEPIHRVLFDPPCDTFLKELSQLPGYLNESVESYEAMASIINSAQKECDSFHKIGMVWEGKCSVITIENSDVLLVAEAFHTFLDPWLLKNPTIEVEYIHGDEVLQDLSKGSANIGFYLPGIDKSQFFGMISDKGPLPRKTFSIGEAEEKRYYLESRKLTV